MSRRGMLLAVTLALVCGAFAGIGRATTAGGPFYLVPSPTKECSSVPSCVSVTGPWVVVPAHGEVTYLVSCPNRIKFLTGGTDAQASSDDIRVWWDGPLGAPLGTPLHRESPTSNAGTVLLFHAVSNDGRMGSFQPSLGCIKLQDLTKRSTLSARVVAAGPAVTPSAALDLRAKQVLLGPGLTLTAKSSCVRKEKIVGSWYSLAFETPKPPDLSHVGAVSVETRVRDNAVVAVIRTQDSLPEPPQAEVQVGAMCEP